MIEEEKIAPHVEDIKRVLGDEVGTEDIEADLRKYLEQYMVPLTEAKRSVVKKHHGDPQQLSSGELVALGNLQGTESSVDVMGRLVTVNESESQGKDGLLRKRWWGLMEDEGARLPYTAWNDYQLKPGEVLQIRNAYARLNPKGEVQVQMGDRASVVRMPPETIPPSTRTFDGPGAGADGGGRWTYNTGYKPLSELEEGMSGVEVKARILTVSQRTVTIDGGEKKLWSGVLGDASGAVNFSAWHDFGLESDAVVNVRGGYVKNWRGAPQFTFDERSTVEALGGDDVPPGADLARMDIADLREGMGYVNVTGRVMSVTERTVDARGETKTVYSGELADTSGSIPFSAWHDFKLKPGDVVRVRGGYIRYFRGPQLTFDERCALENLDDGALPPEKELARPAFREIVQLIETGGGNNISVRGVVLDVKESSGLVFRCPEEGCGRVLQREACMVHGKQEGRPDLRIKGIIDDGTGAISVILGTEPTAEILGRGVDDCVAEARERMGTEFVKDELVDKLVARPLVVEGNVTSDDFGLMMIGRKARVIDVDVKLEAQKLLEEMGV